MARRIFELSVLSDSPVNFMCNKIGSLKNLRTTAFGGHFQIFGLYFILSLEEIDQPSVEYRFRLDSVTLV